jgi:hypothetical protein
MRSLAHQAKRPWLTGAGSADDTQRKFTGWAANGEAGDTRKTKPGLAIGAGEIGFTGRECTATQLAYFTRGIPVRLGIGIKPTLGGRALRAQGLDSRQAA